ncbi:MAG: hypothetical protein ABL857_09320 [Rickettsiales bacterium]
MNTQQDLFDDVARFVKNSRFLLSEGADLELNGLDTQIQNLCDIVLQLSSGEREKYADLLSELLGELKILGDDLLTRKEALANEIRYLSSHKKASVAYKIADAKASIDDTDSDNLD